MIRIPDPELIGVALAEVVEHLSLQTSLEGLPGTFQQELDRESLSQLTMVQPSPVGVESLVNNATNGGQLTETGGGNSAATAADGSTLQGRGQGLEHPLAAALVGDDDNLVPALHQFKRKRKHKHKPSPSPPNPFAGWWWHLQALLWM